MVQFTTGSLRLAILMAISSLPLATSALAQAPCPADAVRGVAYRDFNANGALDPGELPAIGVDVRAYSTAGALLASAITDENGAYSLQTPTMTPLRVEFSTPNPQVYSGRIGSQSFSSVVFLNSAGQCGISFAVSNPSDYCESSPTLAATCFVNGDPLTGGTSGDLDAMVTFPYDANGITPAPTEIAFARQIGSTWGLAYQRSTRRLYATSFLKRHSGYGPLGTGGIYEVDLTGGTPLVRSFIDLRTIGVDTGQDPRLTPGDPGLPSAIGAPSYDPNAYAVIGKQGLGDIEISPDEKTLWTVNLFQRTLVEIYIGVPPQVPTAANVRQYPIPNMGCSQNDHKPFGLTIDQGKLYVGVTCSAETSQSVNDLKAMILEFNGATFSKLFEFPLNYPRGFGIPLGFPAFPGISSNWRPFPLSFAQVLNGNPVPNPGAFYIYPNPVLSAFNFLRDRTLVMSVMDIFGHRGGPFNYAPQGTALIEHTPPSGDILLASLVNGSYVLESNSMLQSTNPLFANPTAGQNNNQGPGGGERIHADNNWVSTPTGNIDTHQELSLGGLFAHPAFYETLPGGIIEDDIINVAYNPLNRFESAGFRELSLSTGDVKRAYEVYRYDPVTDPGRFGKAAGLGDIEALCAAAPIEIGNRVWLDINKNGIQDAGEQGIAGVTVSLYNQSGQLIGTTTTSLDGSYYFRTESGLLPHGICSLRIDRQSDYLTGGPLSGLVLTTANAGGREAIDSDGTMMGNFAVADCETGAPGQNNHTYDFGFQSASCEPTDLSQQLIQLDNSGVELRNLARQLGKRIAKLSSQKSCNNQSIKKILAEQEKDYLALWNSVWAIPPQSIQCATTPLSCVNVNISTQTTAVADATGRMVGRVESLGKNRCFQGRDFKKFKKKNKKILEKIVSDSASALTVFGNGIQSCSL